MRRSRNGCRRRGAGLALDTPLLMFANRDAGTLDVTTGLAYPAKAERARHDRRVGLAVDGSAGGQPVVVMRALATVRDTDIQHNAERYLDLFAPMLPMIGGGAPWAQCREAVWYWARQFIENTVTRIMWWPDVDHLDDEPALWDAQPRTTAPASDPAPATPPSPGSRWAIADWRERAGEVLADQIPAWLSRLDADGFPVPFRVRDVQLYQDGLALDIPGGQPWPALDGPASICFSGQATFVGELEHDGASLRVDRMIADLPMVREPHQVFAPEPDTRRCVARTPRCRTLAARTVPPRHARESAARVAVIRAQRRTRDSTASAKSSQNFARRRHSSATTYTRLNGTAST